MGALESIVESSGFSIGAAVAEKQTNLVQEIESKLAELEELTADAAPEATVSTATGPNLDQSLQALGESCRALHANLERCTDPSARIVAGRYLVDSAQQWRFLSREVLQSLATASALIQENCASAASLALSPPTRANNEGDTG